MDRRIQEEARNDLVCTASTIQTVRCDNHCTSFPFGLFALAVGELAFTLLCLKLMLSLTLSDLNAWQLAFTSTLARVSQTGECFMAGALAHLIQSQSTP